MGGSKGSAPTPSGASTTTASSSSGTSQGVFAQGPSAFVSPMYQDFLTQAQQLSDTPFNPNTLATVEPLNAQQYSGINQMFTTGMQAGDFDPSQVSEIQSPYMDEVVQSTQDWFNNQNAIQGNELIGKSIRSGNAFGGDRMGIAQSELAGQQQLAQAPVIAGLKQSGYTQALDEYNKLKQFGMAGSEQAIKAGTVMQAQAQRERDIAQQNAMTGEAYPFQLENWYGSALGGLGPLTGTVGSAQTATTANTEGVTNPPTPNPLTQALGIGSSLIGIGGGLGLFKSGGLVEGEEGYEDDSEGTPQPDDQSDYQREIASVSGQNSDAQPAVDIFGQLDIPHYKQPYSLLDKLKGSSGMGSGSKSSDSSAKGSTQPSAPSTPAASSGAGKTIGAVGGTIIGGPVGGVVGGAAGSILDSLFADGGPVHKADGLGVDDEDEGDGGDTGDTLDTGDSGTVALPGVSVSTASPDTSVASAVPTPDQPPSWLGPGVLAQPETRRPAVSSYVVAPDAPDAAPPTTEAGGQPTYRRLPGLAPPPKTFSQRWSENPFTQAGIAMLSSRSPYLGEGLGAGLAGASRAVDRTRAQDVLDAKPQMITHGDTIQYRVGDMLVDTKIPTQTRAQKDIANRLAQKKAGKAGTDASTAVTDRHVQSELRRQAKQTFDDLSKHPDWISKTDVERRTEADIRAREQWNANNPKYQVTVPERPKVAAAPEPEPSKPSAIKEGIREIGKGMTGEGGAGGAGIELVKKGWNAITGGGDTAKPATPAPAAPAAPTPAPASQKAKPSLSEQIKSGSITKERALSDAKTAIANGKDRNVIFGKLKEAGIDYGELIGAPMPNAGARPQVPMSQ